MSARELVEVLRRCDTYRCKQRAVAFWHHRKFCGDCAAFHDAIREKEGLDPMPWTTEPAE